MGLFSKTVLTQASSTQKLIEDTPDIIKPSVISSIIEGTDLTANLTNNIMNSFTMNVDRYYSYGRDHFTNGLPEGSIGYVTTDLSKVLESVNQEFPPDPDTENRIDVGYPDALDVSWFAMETLRNTTDWNPSTGVFTYNGIKYTANVDDATYVSSNQFNLEITTLTEPPKSSTITLTTASKYLMVDTENYFYVEYTVVDVSGNPVGYPHFWVYQISTQEYPALQLPDGFNYTQYLPIVPLRINNVSLTGEEKENTELYKTSKKLLDKIGLSINQLDEGVNNNPDIEQVDHAYVVFGASLHSEKPETNVYLFNFFDDLQDRDIVTYRDFQNWKMDNQPLVKYAPPINTVKIYDGTYNTRLVYYYISKSSRSGKLGKIGTVNKIISGGRPRRNIGDPSVSGGITGSYENPDNTIVLEKQVTATRIDIITVSGAIFVNNIYGGRDYITGINPTPEDTFIIPINKSVVGQMDILDRNVVYYDAMRIVFNAFEYTKLKWYETGFFRFVTIVIAVAITMYTGADLISGAISVAATGGSLALLQYVLTEIAINMIIAYSFKLVAQEVGVDVALLLAVTLAMTGNIGSLMELPFASQLAMAGSIGIGASVSTGMAGLQEQFDKFALEVEQRQEAIDQANDLLGDPLSELLDPTRLFTDVGMLPMESTDSFYTRTLTVNGGTTCYKYLSEYYDNALKIPLMENYYGGI